jgi:maltose alpha-D-glucosyltransferase/alpha-amylase
VIALLAGFTPNQGDGWTFTLDALARYFERVLESRAALTPAALVEMVGGVYPERAQQLGHRTAEMHLALASGEERAEFAAEPYSTLYQRSLYQAMRGSAGRVLRQLRRQSARLPDAIRADTAEIASSQNRIFASFARLLSRKIAAAKIRIHGDFHLGQVLNTGKDFVILDFEGEPRLSLGERLLKHSPLRDVAGMLRSFDYAAAAALRLQNPADAARLEPWARGWVDAVTRYFLDSYFSTVNGAAFLPPDPADVALLLDLFTLSKAIYEIGYELSYRPDFLSIPTGAVRRLLAEKSDAK